MAFLMRKMKELLIRRRHKQYEKAVEEQKLSYNDWIEKKEKEQQIEDVRVENSWKCLTNEEKSGINEGKQMGMKEISHSTKTLVENAQFMTKQVINGNSFFL